MRPASFLWFSFFVFGLVQGEREAAVGFVLWVIVQWPMARKKFSWRDMPNLPMNRGWRIVWTDAFALIAFFHELFESAGLFPVDVEIY